MTTNQLVAIESQDFTASARPPAGLNSSQLVSLGTLAIGSMSASQVAALATNMLASLTTSQIALLVNGTDSRAAMCPVQRIDHPAGDGAEYAGCSKPDHWRPSTD